MNFKLQGDVDVLDHEEDIYWTYMPRLPGGELSDYFAKRERRRGRDNGGWQFCNGHALA